MYMPNSIYNTARGTMGITPEQIVVDMSNEISLLQPRLYPLTVILKKLSTNPTHNYRFDWLDDSLLARWCSAAAQALADATTVTLGTGEGALVGANDLIKVIDTDEVIKVDSVAGDVATVTRGYGVTTADVIPEGAKLLIMGNAMAQGSASSAEKYQNTVPFYNYTQIIKTSYSITNTLDAMKLYGGAELNRLRKKKGIEHGESIEYALMLGERKLDTSGSQPTTTTGGIMQFLKGVAPTKTLDTSTVTDLKLQKKALDDFIEEVMTYGSSKKLWICSPTILNFVNNIAYDKLQLVQSDNDKTFGLDITQWRTPHGTLNITQHPLLTQGLAGHSIVLDTDELEYRPLTGRDTQLKTNIQNNDEDGKREMYITEAGLQIRQPKKHGIFIVK